MYTAIYMAETGNIEERKFETLEESRAFFKDLAKKNIPIKKPDIEDIMKKTRLDELESLLMNESQLIRKGPIDDIMGHIKLLVKYEIEKHDLLLKKQQ